MFFGAGLIPIAFLRNNPEEREIFPEDIIFGYAIVALSCFFSLFFLKDMLYGAAIITLLSLWATVRFWKIPPKKNKSKAPNFSFIVKLIFVLLIGLVYGPLLVGLYDYVKIPDIYDLPKHISAIISAAHAVDWPMQNPWFPPGEFAYNMLFYTPLGFICRLTESTSLTGTVFSFSVLWVTWQGLSVVESVMKRLRIPGEYIFVGMILTGFITGFTPLLVERDCPIGFFLYIDKLVSNERWFDSGFLLNIFVPQHIFAVISAISAWLYLTDSIKLSRKLLLQLVVYIAGLFSSFVLAPFIFSLIWGLLFFQIVLIDPVYKKGLPVKRPHIFYFASYALLLLAISLPFLLEVKDWGGGSGIITMYKIESIKSEFYTFLSIGIIFALSLISLIAFKKRSLNVSWLTYSLQVAVVFLFFMFVKFPDSFLKTSLFLHFLLIPFATLGFYKTIVWISRILGNGSKILLFFLLGYFVSISLVETSYYISSAYSRRNRSEVEVLRYIHKLPFDDSVWIEQPNQNLAAACARKVYMDFAGYRGDAYLPITERSQAKHFFKQINKNSPKEIHAFNNAPSVGIIPTSKLHKYDYFPQQLILQNPHYTLLDLRPHNYSKPDIIKK